MVTCVRSPHLRKSGHCDNTSDVLNITSIVIESLESQKLRVESLN